MASAPLVRRVEAGIIVADVFHKSCSPVHGRLFRNPLAKKLGLKADGTIVLANAPPGFEAALAPLPAGARATRTPSRKPQLVLLFASNLAELTTRFVPLSKRLDATGALWVAWPKRASKKPTDLAEDVVRRIGLDAGMVDVKVCAVDETWSGLKFVYRLKDRKSV